jgi:hypothetical protein
MMSRYEKWSLLVEELGFLAVAGSIFLLMQQTTAQVESLRSSSYIAVNSKQLELDSIFIQNPDLRPYFFEKKKIDKNDKNYYKVVSLADYTIDYFDLFYSQVDYFLPPKIDPKQKAFNSWNTYIKQSFKLSPVLCQRLNEVKSWYTPEFVQFAGSECHY